MASAGTVTVDFAAEVAKFNAQLKTVQKQLGSMQTSFDAVGNSLKSLAGLFSVGLFVAFVKNAAEAADQLGKTADKLGITTERMTTFKLAAELAGISTETLTKTLINAQKILGQAAAGTGKGAPFIEKFGFDIEQLQQLKPDELFLKYADAIGTLSTRSDQFAAAQALFGKSAQEAFTLIQKGRPAIDEAADAVERFGLALSGIETKQVEAAADAIKLLHAGAQGFGQQVALALAPFVEEFAHSLSDATDSGDALKETLGKIVAVGFFAFEALRNGAKTLEAAFFKLAGAGARVLGALSWGDVADSFKQSAEDNFTLAAEAQAQLRSFDQQTEEFLRIMEASREKAAAAVAAQKPEGTAGTVLGLDPAQLKKDLDSLGQLTADALEKMRADSTDAFKLDLALRVDAEKSFRDIQDESDADAQRRIETRARMALQFGQFQMKIDADVVQNALDLANTRFENEILAQQALINAKRNAVNAEIGFLQVLATHSKTAAIALVLINKAKAIALAIQNTAVGATLQLTTGDPYTALARAFAVRAWGAIQIAAIAASGFGEIANINSSGGLSLGSPSNPITTQPTETNAATPGATAQPVTQIIINGNLFSSQETADWLIEQLQEAITDHDVVIIQPSSLQGQKLIGVGA